jgi:hypothetical protein
LSFILKIIIIPLFNSNTLQSHKIKIFIIFYKACELIKDKAHLTEEGIKIIKYIKSKMNTVIRDSKLIETLYLSFTIKDKKLAQRQSDYFTRSRLGVQIAYFLKYKNIV